MGCRLEHTGTDLLRAKRFRGQGHYAFCSREQSLDSILIQIDVRQRVPMRLAARRQPLLRPRGYRCGDILGTARHNWQPDRAHDAWL